jgi:CDP-glucose 4,6-dehydratase
LIPKHLGKIGKVMVAQSFLNPESFSGTRVLVTGHTGFKGTWLTRVLHYLGAHVMGLSLPPEDGSLYGRIESSYIAEQEYFDISDYDQTKEFFIKTRPEIVFHLAAQSLVRRSYRDPMGTFRTNVIGTINVLQASVSTPNVKGVIAATTDKVYRNVEKLTGYKEEDPLGGLDPYSASKSAAEMGITAWQNLAARNSGPQIVSVRSGNVIGGGDHSEDRLIPDLLRGFKQNRPVEIRNPNSLRPWQHVLDPLKGYLMLGNALLQGKRTSKTYNFGPSEDSKLTVAEMSDIACELWPQKATWLHCPSQDNLHESQLLWLSSTRANQHFGWKNLLDARQSIQWSIDWEIECDRSTPTKALDEQIQRYLNIPE